MLKQIIICYADGSFPTKTDKCKIAQKRKIAAKLDNIAAWLTQSGFKVNEEKTKMIPDPLPSP